MSDFILDVLFGEQELAMLANMGVFIALLAFIFTIVAFLERRFSSDRKIAEASARVLDDHPELEKCTEDFKVYARKLMADLGWQSITFKFE